VEFRLLGAVRALDEGEVIALGPRQQRLVFGVLAFQLGRPVSLDRLISLVWPGSPPRTAAHAIRVCVSGLRSIIGEHVTIDAQGQGYVLHADPALFDLHRFQTLVAKARDVTDDTRRIELLDQALEEWRGPVLGDTASDDIRERLFSGLEETRLVAVEDRLEAQLNLGRHQTVVSDLTTLVETHPTRERMVGQLMLALHRGGRTSQALDVARRTRAYLAEELGIDPGRALQDLELAILRDDPKLATPQARRTPAQLPPDIADFTGREGLMDRLDALVAGDSGAVVINAIDGTAGVGKTALAVHWAHRVRHRFPDGQLHLNLRGYALSPPLQPAQALTYFLRSVGVPAEDIPVDLDEATAMYRTALSDKRMLILLDNAVSAQQVRPLLPASPGCVVLVTSRDRLDGLVATNAARRVTLDVLPADEAIALLERMLGAGRVAAEPGAAAELASLCARLPLALRIAAAHLAGRPALRIADHVSALRAGNPVASLQIEGDEETAVAAAFDLSYSALKPDAQRLFRLLGLVPGADVDVAAAAALADLPRTDAEFLLTRLAVAHLIDRHETGRYTFHDLLRRYAWDRAHEEDGKSGRDVARGRLSGHYLTVASAAVDLLYPYMLRLRPAEAQLFTSHAAALGWLDAERANILAAVPEADPPTAVLLADTMRTYLYMRGHNGDLFQVAEAALAVAGDPRALAAAHLGLATAHYSQNDYPEAISHYTSALEQCRAAGWVLGEAAMLNNLGVISEQLGDLDKANERYVQSLELHRREGMRDREGPALMKIGSNHQYRGEFEQAAGYYRQALDISRSLSSRHSEANALHYLGATEFLMGRLDDAYAHNSEALAIYLDLGARNDEAQARSHLANVYRAWGRHSDALESLAAALVLALQTGERRTETWIRNCLGATRQAMGDAAKAIAEYESSLEIARQIGARYEECEALIGLAANRMSTSDAVRAVKLARKTGYRYLQERGEAVLTALTRRREPAASPPSGSSHQAS
jgi:DNA-binding SARP family transcriptional activator/tetratricopeptide (TPR) repeat protein